MPGSGAPIDPSAALTSLGLIVYDWDLASDTIVWGPNAAAVLKGADLTALSTGRGFASAIEPGSGEGRADVIRAATAHQAGSGVAYRARHALRLRNDRLVVIEDSGRWYADASGRPASAHGVVRVGPSDRAGASPDGQAGARARFAAEIAEMVAETRRGRHAMTLVVGALVESEESQEDLGAAMTRVRRLLRQGDWLAMLADDRFALALASCSADDAENALRRLLALVEAQPAGDGIPCVRVRLGAASAPVHATDAAALLRCAEEALALLPAEESSSFALAPGPRASEPSPGTSASTILEALNERHLVLAHQPVVDAQTRGIALTVALPGFRTAAGRMATVGDLAVAVERSGLAPVVDARMLELAADALARDPGCRMAISISPDTLDSTDWLTVLAAHLGARPGIESRLIIAIPERAAARDPQAFRGRLDAMKAIGVAIALEGFGGGHTTLAQLRSFPVDILSLEAAFIQNLARSPDDRFLVRALIDLSHDWGIATLAAGVDDPDAAQMLTDWGVDYLQGAMIGAPVQAEGDGERRRSVA